jgi:hypothetical protein
VKYFCKSLYLPKKGRFFSIPRDKLGIGTGACNSCDDGNQVGHENKIFSRASFFFKDPIKLACIDKKGAVLHLCAQCALDPPQQAAEKGITR